MKEKKQITDTTTRFTMQNDYMSINQFDGGVSQFGRHFLIKSHSRGQARYYTIVNSFSLPIWKNYRKTINIDNVISKRVSINDNDEFSYDDDNNNRASEFPLPNVADY